MGEAGLWGGSLECLWAGALAGEGAGLEQGLVDPTPCQTGEGGGGSSSGKGGKGDPTIQTCLVYGLYLLLLSSLFHFSYFIFSAPISFSLCFPISLSSFFKFSYFLSQAFIKCSRSFCIHIYKYMYNIYILENL